MKNDCEHITYEKQLVDNPCYKGWYGDGEDEAGNLEMIEDWVEVCAYEDIDTHRIKCSLCGHIDYYSGRAKAYYERGETSDGLFPPKS